MLLLNESGDGVGGVSFTKRSSGGDHISVPEYIIGRGCGGEEGMREGAVEELLRTPLSHRHLDYYIKSPPAG